MTAPGSGVRVRRSRPPTVAVTGAAAGLGEALAIRLADDDRIRRVIGLDSRRVGTTGVTGRVADVGAPSLAGQLRGVDTLVHLALDPYVDGRPAPGSRNVRSTATVLQAAAATGVRRVVLCTSAMVYGALPDNPVPLPEDAPLRATGEHPVVADMLEMERLASQVAAANPQLSVTVLRPAVVAGGGAESSLLRHFRAPRLLVVKGSRPRIQFCHVDDLLEAFVLASLGAVDGVATVGCAGWLEQEEVERLCGVRRIELPAAVAFGTAARLQRIGVNVASASELDYLVHPWVVSSSRLREAGWRPAYDNAKVLSDYLSSGPPAGEKGRHIDARQATVASAGATVALVGTAALVRRRRRRRSS